MIFNQINENLQFYFHWDFQLLPYEAISLVYTSHWPILDMILQPSSMSLRDWDDVEIRLQTLSQPQTNFKTTLSHLSKDVLFYIYEFLVNPDLIKTSRSTLIKLSNISSEMRCIFGDHPDWRVLLYSAYPHLSKGIVSRNFRHVYYQVLSKYCGNEYSRNEYGDRVIPLDREHLNVFMYSVTEKSGITHFLNEFFGFQQYGGIDFSQYDLIDYKREMIIGSDQIIVTVCDQKFEGNGSDWIRSHRIKGANAFCLIWDCERRFDESYEIDLAWAIAKIMHAKQYNDRSLLPIVLVGTKSDLASDEESLAFLHKFAKDRNIPFITTSAKNEENIIDAFVLTWTEYKFKGHISTPQWKLLEAGFSWENMKTSTKPCFIQ